MSGKISNLQSVKSNSSPSNSSHAMYNLAILSVNFQSYKFQSCKFSYPSLQKCFMQSLKIKVSLFALRILIFKYSFHETKLWTTGQKQNSKRDHQHSTREYTRCVILTEPPNFQRQSLVSMRFICTKISRPRLPDCPPHVFLYRVTYLST